METRLSLLLGLFLLLLAVDFCLSDSQVDLPTTSGKDPKLNGQSGSNTEGSKLKSEPVPESGQGNKESKNDGEQVTKSQDKKNDSLSGKSGDSKENSVQKGKDDSNMGDGSQVKNKDSKEERSNGESGNDEKPKEKTGQGGVVDPLTNKGKKDSHVEECDQSYKCMDDKIKLAACIRVPGESLDYSLLIQNKGKDPLDITISARGCIQLEATNVQVEGEQDRTMKVSMGVGKREDLIILKASTGICKLNISDLIISHFGRESGNDQKLTNINIMSRTPTIAVVSFAALLIIASAWMCISYRKKRLSNNGSKYQRLEMELPVSGGEKATKEVNDGWDDNWGDDWDDEEAPKTPSMPVTPSVSAKGLASRRLNKDGWKD